MTDAKVFLDTSPIIYLLDNDINFGAKTNRILSSLAGRDRRFVSSVITCTEYLVVPFRTDNRAMTDAFWDFVDECSIVLCP
ncbi:MAG: hypothetical protein IJU05_02995, partial [Schwartzia sp.]|nr:hypothetical protein [Schwartzia sp. (in: firmicutes)]